MTSVVNAMSFPHCDVDRPVLKIYAFGNLSIETASGTFGAKQFGSVKARQLFELLLISRNTTISKQAIADALWDDDLPQKVSATIENYISMLRHQLFVDLRVARNVIVTEHEGYRLSTDAIFCDLDEFDALTTSANRSLLNGEPSMIALDFFDRAIALARGDVLLDESKVNWVLGIRRQYQKRILTALLDAGELNLDLGRTRNAQRYADAACENDRCNDRCIRLAMRVAEIGGSQRKALDIYEEFRRGLAEETGLVPALETQDLYCRILRQESELPRKETLAMTQNHNQISSDETFGMLLKACMAANEIGGRHNVLNLLRDASMLHRHLVTIDFAHS
jgi:DNA-binding SARP family transcriptional activator